MAVFFVVSDVHGFYYQMQQALNEAGFNPDNPNHVFVSLGDLCDRGPNALACINFVNALPQERKILIRGNHEDLMEACIARREFMLHDFHNRTADTVFQLLGYSPDLKSEREALTDMRMCDAWNTYIASCIDYYETDKYVFVHGWIPCVEDGTMFVENKEVTKYKLYEKTDWRHGNWDSARWINCFDAWKCKVTVPNKTVVAGHWYTSYGHSVYHKKCTQFGEDAIFDIFRAKGIIGIDACTSYTGKVNCLKIVNQTKI